MPQTFILKMTIQPVSSLFNYTWMFIWTWTLIKTFRTRDGDLFGLCASLSLVRLIRHLRKNSNNKHKNNTMSSERKIMERKIMERKIMVLKKILTMWVELLVSKLSIFLKHFSASVLEQMVNGRAIKYYLFWRTSTESLTERSVNTG